MTGMSAVKSPWILAFGVVAIAHLFLVGLDLTPWDTVTKCLLAPLLAIWAAQLGGPRLLIVALVLSFVILVAVTGELTGDKHLSTMETVIVIATLSLAWTFANLVYALHYAHLYYSGIDGGRDHAGLDFPGKHPEPDYWDFIYFSFTLGVALQTSDVCITSSGIRRVVTVHCIGAFIYNLVVLALAVNVLAS